MRIKTVAILMVAMGCGSVVSSQPVEIPKSLGASEHPGTQGGRKADDANDHQQNAQPPITIIHPEKSPKELESERQDRQREIGIQDKIGWFTGILVITAVLQTLFGIGALIFTGMAATAAKKSANAAKDALVMTNRPRLVVRPITVKGFEESGRIGGSGLVEGKVWITNVGVLPATLLYFHAEWFFGKGLPLENPAHKAIETATRPAPIPPGYFGEKTLPEYVAAFEVFQAINNAVDIAENEDFTAWREKTSAIHTLPAPKVGTLYLIGYIKYSDQIGPRRTFFCYAYDPTVGYFTPVEHPNYSYEE